MKNITISVKIYLVVALMSLVAGVIAFTSIGSLGAMSQRVNDVSLSVDRTYYAGRATGNMLSYVRAVESLLIDRSAEERRAVEAAAIEELRLLNQRLDQLQPILLNDAGRANLAMVRENLRRYEILAQRLQTLARDKRFDEAD